MHKQGMDLLDMCRLAELQNLKFELGCFRLFGLLKSHLVARSLEVQRVQLQAVSHTLHMGLRDLFFCYALLESHEE
jgi:hypothetical protein